MPGTFSLPPRFSDLDMHYGTCVTHVPWCMPGSLTSGSLWSRWRGKRSRHSRRMRNLQFYVSGKRAGLEVVKTMSSPQYLECNHSYIQLQDLSSYPTADSVLYIPIYFISRALNNIKNTTSVELKICPSNTCNGKCIDNDHPVSLLCSVKSLSFYAMNINDLI